ncbi:hypothetical protein SAMN05518872_11534 [Psychrobacillus sp. OK032]|nr:hypothetical protein SAMN05518872_11534 [Psychrobacillus sp. OK032]
MLILLTGALVKHVAACKGSFFLGHYGVALVYLEFGWRF